MLKVIPTKDGSFSIYNSELDEHYHSTHGALTESRHVYINCGLKHKLLNHPAHIHILEIGFGTGLNAILSEIVSRHHETIIDYTGLEPYPLPAEMRDSLNFHEFLSADEYQIWREMTDGAYRRNKFTFRLQTTGIQDFDSPKKYDLIYFDAFAPEKQPEMWSADVIEKCVKLLNPGGIIVTYCCKGDFKRNLKRCGMKIEKPTGPPGKREILRATLIS